MSTVRSTPDDPPPTWPDSAWVTYATGRKVTVRVLAGGIGPSGGPALRDVVGTLQDATSDAWVIVTRDGTSRTVDPQAVVAAKVVLAVPATRRHASDIDIATLETIAADGWQPLESEEMGDWTLRAADGFTGRANSVLPLGDPGLDLGHALDAVCGWYRQRGLTPMIQVSLPLHTELNEDLRRRGWDTYHPTHVMVSDLDPLRMAVGVSATDRRSPTSRDEFDVTISDSPDAEWVAAFRYGEEGIPSHLVAMLTKTSQPVFVTVRRQDGTVGAIGRGAVTDRWLGITAVDVAPDVRRQGLGRRVIAALADHATRTRAMRVRHVYLQVGHHNQPAIGLYQALGFAHHHDYVYRCAPQRAT